MITRIITSLSIVALALVVVQQAQAIELIMELHEDYSVTFKLNGTEIKGYANLEGAAGQYNGIIDVVEQMDLVQ